MTQCTKFCSQHITGLLSHSEQTHSPLIHLFLLSFSFTFNFVLLFLLQRVLHSYRAFEEVSWKIYQAMGKSRRNGTR